MKRAALLCLLGCSIQASDLHVVNGYVNVLTNYPRSIETIPGMLFWFSADSGYVKNVPAAWRFYNP